MDIYGPGFQFQGFGLKTVHIFECYKVIRNSECEVSNAELLLSFNWIFLLSFHSNMRIAPFNSWTVSLAAVFAMIFWGMSFIWSSIVFEYYEPITTIFLRLSISSIFLFLVLFVSGYLQRIKRQHYLLILTSAVFNPFLYFLGENFGLKYSSASISAVVIATIPVFTPIAAWLMIREKVSILNIMGIGVSFAGILVMLLKPDMSFSHSPSGILLLFLAVFSAVVYSVFLKRLTENYNPMSIIAWQNLIGALLFLPLFLIFDRDSFLASRPDLRMFSALFSLAILASSMAYVLFTFTVKHLGVSRANVYSNLIPVITAFASYFILNELFSTGKILGMFIVISGVIITQIHKLKRIK